MIAGEPVGDSVDRSQISLLLQHQGIAIHIEEAHNLVGELSTSSRLFLLSS